MSDETDFIRAIQAAPGDDAPRLVYADWLEERGDPRARFLRDECQAAAVFRAGDSGPARKLRAEAWEAGLDWALSVARPPVGVCAPLAFIDPGEPVAADQLDAAAQQAGISLPPDYRAFLLLYNGGKPVQNQLKAPDPDYGEITVQEFWRFDPAAGFVTVLNLYQRHMDDDDFEELFAVLLPVGTPGMDEDSLAVSLAPEHFGAVFYVPYIEGLRRPRRLADSFAEFLALLKDQRPEGIRLAEAGDAAGMARWLDAGGDPFEKDPETGYTVMDHVVTGNKAALLRAILDRKPTFPPAAADRVRKQIKGVPYNRYTEICKLIESYLGK